MEGQLEFVESPAILVQLEYLGTVIINPCRVNIRELHLPMMLLQGFHRDTIAIDG